MVKTESLATLPENVIVSESAGSSPVRKVETTRSPTGRGDVGQSGVTGALEDARDIADSDHVDHRNVVDLEGCAAAAAEQNQTEPAAVAF
jgi:hypothetical protein